MQYQALLDRHSIISDQISRPSLAVVLRELETVLVNSVEGDIAEFGCYIGTSSLFIRRLLDSHSAAPKREFYAYDSFAGLPSKRAEDSSGAGEEFKAGELAVSKKQFLQQFHKAGLQAPRTYKSWFKDLRAEQLPQKIAFAFLDGDFYESIYDSLELVWPRLAENAVITIDDYGRAALPGVERAVHEFLRGQAYNLRHEQGIGILSKR